MSNVPTIRQVLDRAYTELIEIDSARLDSEILLAHCLQKTRSYLYSWPEKALTNAQQHQFESYIQRRKQHMPIAYLLEQKEFWSLMLQINQHTLIPRPATETLVQACLRQLTADDASVLELATGSGAVAIALAFERNQLNILATDICEPALALAYKNAHRHKCENIKFQHSDWFSHITGEFNLIVSNPPYIAATDPHLCVGDVQHEPDLALIGGADGLKYLRHIIKQAPQYLAKQGKLLLEHGHQQANDIRQLFTQAGFVQIESLCDMDNCPRVTFGTYG